MSSGATPWCGAFEKAAVGVSLNTLDGRFVAANSACQRMLGYAAEELRSLSITDVTFEEDLEPTREILARLAGGASQHVQFEARYRRKDGALIWVRVNGSRVPLPDSGETGCVCLVEDVTERKLAERALKESEQRFRVMAEALRDYSVIMLDPAGRILDWNAGAQRIKGHATEEIIGRHFSCFYTAEDTLIGKPDRALRLAAGEGRFEDEGWRVRKDGSRFWASTVIIAVHDEASALRGFLKVTRDLTERMRTQDALQHEKDRLALLLELTNSIVSSLDLHELMREISSNVRRVMHCDFVGVSLPDSSRDRLRLYARAFPRLDQLPEEALLPLAHPAMKVFQTGKAMVFDPRTVPNLTMLSAAHQSKSVCYVPLISRDRVLGVLGLGRYNDQAFSVEDVEFLTQVAAQAALALDNALSHEKLARKEAFLAQGERLSQTGSWSWNAVTRTLSWSQEAYRIYGVDPSTKPTLPMFLSMIHPDDRSRVEAAIPEALREKRGYEMEFRIVRTDGSIRDLRAIGHPVLGPTGDVAEFVGSTQDITDRKRAEAEKERLEALLRQSQKMEALGTFAGGIAHDFNNILGAILGYGDMAQQAAPEGSALRRYAENVISAGNRAKALVERILAFSRSGMTERAPVHVESVVAETVGLLRPSLPSGIEVDLALHAGNASVVGDATQIHEVVMNLCTNAIHAMAGTGKLTVTLDRVSVAERREVSNGLLAPGEYVRLAVSDTGVGIAPEVRERMFDPFFTTKGVGQGTGLGLSFVHSITGDLGGSIDVQSQLGEGTTFTVYFPRAGETSAPTRSAPSNAPRGNGECILLVDDEPMLVMMGEEILAGLGYEPVGFTDSRAALQRFRADPERFDAVMTDQTMPEITGTELAHELHKVRPDIPILLMSGYRGPALAELAAQAGIATVLKKPLQPGDIAEHLAEGLKSVSRLPSRSSGVEVGS